MAAQPEIKVWDISTRLFHWLLFAAVLMAWVSVELRWMIAHQISGVTIVGLLVYRFIWGFVGSSTARFAGFLSPPVAAARYAYRSMVELQNEGHAGHNPAGGLMVAAFLAVLTLQVVSGLFANDDLGFFGPLADLVSKRLSDDAAWLHGWLFQILLVMIWFHLFAVFFYVLVKGKNLITAMITGRKPKNEIDGNDELSIATAKQQAIVALIAVAGILWLMPFGS